MTAEQVIQLLFAVGFGGIVTSAIQGLLQRKKLGADYASTIASSANMLLKPLAERVQELETDLAAARRELAAARVEVKHLRREVVELRAAANQSES